MVPIIAIWDDPVVLLREESYPHSVLDGVRRMLDGKDVGGVSPN